MNTKQLEKTKEIANVLTKGIEGLEFTTDNVSSAWFYCNTANQSLISTIVAHAKKTKINFTISYDEILEKISIFLW